MRVLAIVHRYPPFHMAGAEVMLHAILDDWVEHGHTCHVVYPDPPCPYRYQGVTVSKTPAHLDELALGADVVITHLDKTGAAMTAARQSGRPLVHLLHNDRQLQDHHVKLGACVLLVANSEWIAATIPAGVSYVIARPHVDVDRYSLLANEQRDRVTLVNLNGAKGGPFFTELARSEPARKFLGVRGCYGVQHAPRGPSNIEVIENTPNIRDDVYARTRVLLMPSAYESWGRVGIEAACSGIPTIATPTPGLREALAGAGIFVALGSAREWRRALAALDDPVTYRAASRRARARAEELERITRTDLEHLECAVREIVRRAQGAPAYHPTDPVILDTLAASIRCPVCDEAGCSCEGTDEERLAGLILAAIHQRGAGTLTLETWRARRADPGAAKTQNLEPSRS